MAIVTTVPKKGETSQAYNIPDADLAKYDKAQTRFVEGEEMIAGAANVEEGEPIADEGAEVEAYAHRICYCWYWVGDQWIRRRAPCWWSRCP